MHLWQRSVDFRVSIWYLMHSTNTQIKSTKRERLLDFILQIQRSELKNLHILCTSRREVDIEKAFKSLFAVSATANVDVNLVTYRSKVDHDIGIHIKKTLASTPYDEWSPDLKDVVRQALIERADGMYVPRPV